MLAVCILLPDIKSVKRQKIWYKLIMKSGIAEVKRSLVEWAKYTQISVLSVRLVFLQLGADLGNSNYLQ